MSLKEKRKLSEYPPQCLYLVPESGKLALIIRGEQGYCEVDQDKLLLPPRKEGESIEDHVRRANQVFEVSEEMERDMVMCSMFDQWPDPESVPIAAKLMPNIDTEEKARRLQELMEQPVRAEYEVTNFCSHNEDDISTALRQLIEHQGGYTCVMEDEGGEPLDLHQAFLFVIRKWRSAVDRMQYFACTGKER